MLGVVGLAATCVVALGPPAAQAGQTGDQPSPSSPTVGAATTSAVSAQGRTVTVSSEAALQTAVKGANPGDTIALRPGTYSGALKITRSGTASAPITLTSTGGVVTLTANLRMPKCGATSPDPNRTIEFGGGASHWNIKGLHIRGGITIMGDNAGLVRQWLTRHSNDYKARRAVPGRATYDPSGILASTTYLQRQVNATLRPSLGISITNNVMTLKGIQSAMNKNGVISGNQISNIACGVGPGIWLGTFSDGWQVSGNTIHDIAASTWKHYMQEGVRVGGSSAYNLVTNNTVYNLPGDGRAFTTDEDGSWNTFSRNTATNVAIGYNDQKSGWGNRWTGNRVNTFRTAAFSFRMMDSGFSSPSRESSTFQATVSCNSAVGGRVVFQAGAMGGSTVSNNAFNGQVQLSSNLRRYWSSVGNTWDGSKRAPAERVSQATAGC